MTPSRLTRLARQTKRALTPQRPTSDPVAGHPPGLEVIAGEHDPVIKHPQGLQVVAEGQDPVLE